MSLQRRTKSPILNNPISAGEQTTNRLRKSVANFLLLAWKPLTPKASGVEVKFIHILKIDADGKGKPTLCRYFQHYLNLRMLCY